MCSDREVLLQVSVELHHTLLQLLGGLLEELH
jgi:hypothetical protein